METVFRHYLTVLLCASRICDNSCLPWMVAPICRTQLHYLELYLDDKLNISAICDLERDLEMMTPEELKEYRLDYYLSHIVYYRAKNKKYAAENPKKMAEYNKQFHIRHPHYERDLKRRRKAATEPLIFQFLDNGFSGDIEGYITYLRSRGIPKQHIKWFKADMQKHIT